MKPKNKRNFLELLGTVGNSLNFYRNLQRYMLEHPDFEDVWESADKDLRDEILYLINGECVKPLRELIDDQKPIDNWPHKQLVRIAKELRVKNYSRMNVSELREVLHEKRRNDRRARNYASSDGEDAGTQRPGTVDPA